MKIIDKIATSPHRANIDKMFLDGIGLNMIARLAKERYGLDCSVKNIRDYRKFFLTQGKSTIHTMLKVEENLAKYEMAPKGELDRISNYFSFSKTCDDLDLLYERIRVLREYAKNNPADSSFDDRIINCITKVEAIRTRVYRHQYEHLRRAVMLTIGKKICLAAVSILTPYIHENRKDEAMRRFQAAIEPLLDFNAAPDVPRDIVDEEKTFKVNDKEDKTIGENPIEVVPEEENQLDEG